MILKLNCRLGFVISVEKQRFLKPREGFASLKLGIGETFIRYCGDKLLLKLGIVSTSWNRKAFQKNPSRLGKD